MSTEDSCIAVVNEDVCDTTLDIGAARFILVDKSANIVVNDAIEVFNLTCVARSEPVTASDAARAARLICVLREIVPRVVTLTADATNCIEAVIVVAETVATLTAVAANCIEVVILEEDFATQEIDVVSDLAMYKSDVAVQEHVAVAASSAAGPIPEDDNGLELKGKNPSMLSR